MAESVDEHVRKARLKLGRDIHKTFRRDSGEIVQALDGVSLEVGTRHAYGSGGTGRRRQDHADPSGDGADDR